MACKVGITLLVRDEADIIEDWIGFHSNNFDHIYVTDNGSVDGTREMIESVWSNMSTPITIFDEPEQNFNQPKWVDRMIRQAKADGCGWVVNSDADEFWSGNYWTLAANAPAHIGGYRVESYLHVPTITDDENAVGINNRRPWYVVAPRNPVEAQCMKAWHKIFHRTDCYLENILGNQDVKFSGNEAIVDAPEGYYIDHFSERSWDHFRRKYINGGEAYTRSSLPYAYGFHWRDTYKIYTHGGGITALKKEWRRRIARNFSCLARD
jgi:hypothetical protein